MENKKIEKRKKQSGYTLLSTVVSLSVASIGMVGFAQMMSNMTRENKALSEKIEFNDAKRLLTSSLSDDSICTNMLTTTNIVLPTSQATLSRKKVQLNRIPAAVGGSTLIDTSTPYNGKIRFSSINMSNFRNVAPNRYLADLVVQPDSTDLVRELAPFRMTFNISTDATTNAITGCGNNTSGAAGVAAGATCGQRGAMCGGNTIHYDMYGSDSIACDGNDLTVSCDFRYGNTNPSVITGVQGCPNGYTGKATYTGTYWVFGYYNQYYLLTCVKD